MKSEESLKSTAKWLKCNSIACYFTAAVCVGGLGASVKEYVEDVQGMTLNSQTYSSEAVLARLSTTYDAQLMMPIAGSGLGLLAGVFFTLGRRKKEDAGRIDKLLASVSEPLPNSGVS